MVEVLTKVCYFENKDESNAEISALLARLKETGINCTYEQTTEPSKLMLYYKLGYSGFFTIEGIKTSLEGLVSKQTSATLTTNV